MIVDLVNNAFSILVSLVTGVTAFIFAFKIFNWIVRSMNIITSPQIVAQVKRNRRRNPRYGSLRGNSHRGSAPVCHEIIPLICVIILHKIYS